MPSFAISLTWSAVVALVAFDAPHADLVLSGGKIWPGDCRQPEAEALAIWQDKILAVGTYEQIDALVGPLVAGWQLGPRIADTVVEITIVGGRVVFEEATRQRH